MIVVDPRENALSRKADYWLRVRPGSDGALAMAMTHVLFEENLYDHDFSVTGQTPNANQG